MTDIDGRNRVQRVATRPVVFVHANETLRAVATTLVEESIGAALVRGPHGALGLVSERDIVRALADGANADRTTASEVMAEELVTVHSSDDLLEAVHCMLDNEVRHLPVQDGGVTLGMVSARDALRAVTQELETRAPTP
jgi:signal-transduction protein with cAMP-binding, CBS, and nucleotidyltransferase domain